MRSRYALLLPDAFLTLSLEFPYLQYVECSAVRNVKPSTSIRGFVLLRVEAASHTGNTFIHTNTPHVTGSPPSIYFALCTRLHHVRSSYTHSTVRRSSHLSLTLSILVKAGRHARPLNAITGRICTYCTVHKQNARPGLPSRLSVSVALHRSPRTRGAPRCQVQYKNIPSSCRHLSSSSRHDMPLDTHSSQFTP